MTTNLDLDATAHATKTTDKADASPDVQNSRKRKQEQNFECVVFETSYNRKELSVYNIQSTPLQTLMESAIYDDGRPARSIVIYLIENYFTARHHKTRQHCSFELYAELCAVSGANPYAHITAKSDTIASVDLADMPDNQLKDFYFKTDDVAKRHKQDKRKKQAKEQTASQLDNLRKQILQLQENHDLPAELLSSVDKTINATRGL